MHPWRPSCRAERPLLVQGPTSRSAAAARVWQHGRPKGHAPCTPDAHYLGFGSLRRGQAHKIVLQRGAEGAIPRGMPDAPLAPLVQS